MKFGEKVVKYRLPILILTLLLMIPSIFGIANTRINYDMLNYLPEDIDTVVGQDVLLEDFGKGAFSFIVVEDMEEKDIAKLSDKLKTVDHVETVLWYNSFASLAMPIEILPQEIYEEFNTDDATLIAVFFDTSTSADETLDAIRDIRAIAGKQCFVSGMSALVTDLEDLCEKEEPIYVGLAVICATVVMLLLLDSWLVPFIFLVSIAMMIILNLGTNIFLGEISYITKALSAVLQLAVTMDYSIFLWHSYNEQLEMYEDHHQAMAIAIKQTLTSVIGSSITTVAGFIALCFMTFTLGKDLGIVMAKGVIFGVIGCVTVLPSLILLFDKQLSKTKHKTLIPEPHHLSKFVTKRYPIFLIIFVILVVPSFMGYSKTNKEVYYDLGECLPKEMEYVIANNKLSEEFDIASTHMILVDNSLGQEKVTNMIKEIEEVDGVKYVLGIETLIGNRIPKEFLPEHVLEVMQSDNYELLLINSEYKVASDEVNLQVGEINDVLKKYDDKGMLIGEAPCMKDMIQTTDRDFRVVNVISILAIFVIIALVEKSYVVPFILISVIELAIFINLGIPHYLGQSLPFIAPICISTIQLGATVDYAILMTTRYKEERKAGSDKRDSVTTALRTSIPSIIVSGAGLFAATFGVAVYSDIDMISSMCMLMARGALISMLCVIFILPALFMLCDKLICRGTKDLKNINFVKEE